MDTPSPWQAQINVSAFIYLVIYFINCPPFSLCPKADYRVIKIASIKAVRTKSHAIKLHYTIKEYLNKKETGKYVS